MGIQSEVIYTLYEKMTEQHIISAYHGDFTHEVVNMLLRQAKWDLNHRQVNLKTAKKTYGVLVECLDNILKHTSIINDDSSRKPGSDGIVIFSHHQNDYYVIVGNLVSTNLVDTLKARLDHVNGLDKAGLKEHHEHILRTGSISEKGGAGLGIIDMVMKSGNKLGYDFKKYNDELSFFTLKVTISETATA